MDNANLAGPMLWFGVRHLCVYMFDKIVQRIWFVFVSGASFILVECFRIAICICRFIPSGTSCPLMLFVFTFIVFSVGKPASGQSPLCSKQPHSQAKEMPGLGRDCSSRTCDTGSRTRQTSGQITIQWGSSYVLIPVSFYAWRWVGGGWGVAFAFALPSHVQQTDQLQTSTR